MLQEKYRVPHFDAKAEADAYFAGLPTRILVTSFYWDNLYMFGLAPKKGDDGVYSWTFPMGNSKLAGIAAEDIGKVAYGIFKAGQQYIGKTVGIAGENLTIDEMGDKLSKGLGIGPVKYNAVDADAYRGFGFPGADEMGNMFQVYRDFEKEVLAARSADVDAVSSTRSCRTSISSSRRTRARSKRRMNRRRRRRATGSEQRQRARRAEGSRADADSLPFLCAVCLPFALCSLPLVN